jgi:VanZ family protein
MFTPSRLGRFLLEPEPVSGPERLGRRAALAGGVACILVIVVLSVIPLDPAKRTGAGGFAEHFIAYAATAGLFGLGLGPSRRHAVAVFAGLTLMSIALEIAQMFTPGRTPEIKGAVSAAVGAALALSLLAWLRHVWGRRACARPSSSGSRIG